MTASTLPEITGYTSCVRCGAPWVLKVVASRTGGLCPDKCWIETRGAKKLPVRSHGVTFEVSRTGARKNKPKKMTPRRRERIKLRDKARLAALRRLADAHPVEFSELLAEERHHAGLDPWTIDGALSAQLKDATS